MNDTDHLAGGPASSASPASPASPAGPVGFVGAGSMGGPMVERLLAAGVRVHLFARRPEVAERFRQLGAVVEPTVARLAAAAELLVVCPFSEAQLTDLLSGDEGLLAHARPGAVVVQHATVSVVAIERLAQLGAARGVTVLDAPISGTSAAIRAGQLTVLLGGDAAAAAKANPALTTYASTILRTGDVGSATVVKLVNNLTFAANVQNAVGAVRLGEKLGVKLDDLLAALSVCSADSAALRHLRAVGSVEQFTELAGPYLRKDVAVVEAVAARSGLDTGILGDVVRDGPVPLSSRPPQD